MKLLRIFSLIFLFSIVGCASLQMPADLSTDHASTVLIDLPVWISHMAGLQCQSPFFRDLDDAMNELIKNQIQVLESKIIYKYVIKKCDSPSGQHYAAKISLSDFEKAKDIGWKSCEVINY